MMVFHNFGQPTAESESVVLDSGSVLSSNPLKPLVILLKGGSLIKGI